MKNLFYTSSVLIFLVCCSKGPDIIDVPNNSDPNLDSLGITIDSLGNYIDSIGNTVTLDSLGNIIIVDSVIAGCTESTACNYNINATTDDGSCIMPDGCTDPSAINYNPSAVCDDQSCVLLFQSCTDATGEWEIGPACPDYELPILDIVINIEDRFDDIMSVVCDANRLNIDFGSNQTAYAEIDNVGQLIIPNQSITLDLQNEGYGFIDVDIYGDGAIYGTNGILNITFVFEILPGVIDSTSCVLSIDKQ